MDEQIDLSLETSIRARLNAYASMTPEERRQRWEDAKKIRESEEKALAAADAARAAKRAEEIEAARLRFKNRVPGDLSLGETKAAITVRLNPQAALKPAKTPEELAKKHGVSVAEIIKRLDQGQKVEREHTKSNKEARHIASHHIWEFLNYYDALAKMEQQLKKRAAFDDPNMEWTHHYSISVTFDRVAPKLVEFCKQALANMGYVLEVAEQYQYLIVGYVDPKANKEDMLSEDMKKAAVEAEVSKINHAIGKWAKVALTEYDRPKKKQ